MFNQLDAQGLKCKECKFRCHTQCEAQVNLFAIVNIVAIIQPPLSSSVQVPPSCGLPAELLEIYWEHMKVNSSQNVSLNGISQKPFSQVVSHNGISQKCFSQRNLKGSRGKPESATSLAASRPDQSLREGGLPQPRRRVCQEQRQRQNPLRQLRQYWDSV